MPAAQTRSTPAPMLPRRGQPAPIFRIAAATVRAFATNTTVEKAGRELYGRDGFETRAASSSAQLGTPAWAGAVGQDIVGDLLQATTTLSAAANLMARGLQISLAGLASLRVPGRLADPSLAVSWLAEGAPIPLKAPPLIPGPTLRPKKIGVLSAYSAEQAASSSIDTFIRQALIEATGLALDAAMFSSAPEGAAPPGILSNAVTVTASTASAGWALSADIGSLIEGLSSVGAGAEPILVCAPHQYASLHTWTSEAVRFYPIFCSTALDAGTIVAVERSSFVSSYDPTPEFSTSIGAAVHFEDTVPSDISASGTVATPVKSMFQSDLIGLKMILRTAWALRNSAHVAICEGVSW
jgi:hypothetical protein